MTTISLQRTHGGAVSMPPRHGYRTSDPVKRPYRIPGTASFHELAASLGVQQLVRTFGPAFPHMRILRDLVIPMPAACRVPSARIDAVIVCETGLYLFEIKAWRNAFVYRKNSEQAPPRWFLRLRGCSRAREVSDPALQGGRKTTQLRSLLPDDLRLQYFVLLPCEGVELEGVMPAAIVTHHDLSYIARLARNNGRTARSYPLLNADAIERTVQLLVDIQGDLTIDDHMHNCREGREGASALTTQ